MVCFTDLSLMEFYFKYYTLFCLFSVIDILKWFWIESHHKNIQLMLELLKAPFLVQHFSYYTFINFPDDVISNNAVYVDVVTFYCKCVQASDLRQQLELAFKLGFRYMGHCGLG